MKALVQHSFYGILILVLLNPFSLHSQTPIEPQALTEILKLQPKSISFDDNKSNVINSTASTQDPNAPIATADTYTLFASTTLSLPAPGFLANDIDPNGEALTATVITQNVSNGSLAAFPNGSFTYTPEPGFTGTDQFSYSMRNASLHSSEPAVVTLIVLPQPDRDPIATADTYTLFAGTSLTIPAPGFLANDIDPYGETLTATLITQNVSNGNLSAFPSGTFTYTPNPGFTGTDQFSYTMRNASNSNSEPTVVTLVVLPPPTDDIPIATADTYTLFAGTSLNLPAPGFLANDIDPNGEALTAALITQNVSNGSLAAFPNGSFTYTPNPGFTGTDEFSYSMRNASFHSSEPAVVTLIVLPQPDRDPIATADTYTLFAGTSLTIPAPGFLANDIDPYGETLTATVITQNVSNGSLSAFPSGTFTYTPDPGFTGTDQFSYTMRNVSFHSSEPTVVTLVVIPLNHAPIADAGNDQIVECSGPGGQTIILDGSSSNDPDGDLITYSWYVGADLIAGPTTEPTVEVMLGLGEHLIRLEVDDGSLSDTNEVLIKIEDTTPPLITLLGESEIRLDCGTPFLEPGANAMDICDPDVEVEITGIVNNQIPETYILTYTAMDASGNTAVPVVRTIIVEDVTPPMITVLSPVTILWPPNHTYYTLSLTDLDILVEDGCEQQLSYEDVVIASAWSDEKEDANGGGDGFTKDDIIISSGCQSIDLRAERHGSGNGRVYTVNLEVTDSNGNVGTTSYEVHTPQDIEVSPLAIGGAAKYSVSSGCASGPSPSMVATRTSDMDGKHDLNLSEGYALEANYPNPFHQETTINFVVPVYTKVSLRVYNMQGREIAVLVDGYRQAGRYEQTFNATGLINGLYILRLESGSFQATRQMVIIK